MTKEKETNKVENKKSNKTNVILLSGILVAVLSAGTYMVVTDLQDKNNTNQSNNVSEVNKIAKENENVLNKEKILAYMNQIIKDQESIANADEKFLANQDMLLSIQYRDAALYYKYFIDPLLSYEPEEGEKFVYKFENIKLAYQNPLISTMKLDEKEFAEFITIFEKGLSEVEFKGTSLSDKKLVDELNALMKKESQVLKQIYETYELDENNFVVLKAGKTPIDKSILEELNDSFYKENDLSNHYVQYTTAFELFNNELTLHGKINESYLTHLLNMLNSVAYYEYAVLDDYISNISYNLANKDKTLSEKEIQLLLNQISKVRVELDSISDNNFYKQQIVQNLDRFEKLVKDNTKTLEELSTWYTINPNDIIMFSKDSVRNSFFMISDVE